MVKLAGQVEIGPDGQLTTTVEESPQVPFEDFKLDFFGGARAPLAHPVPLRRLPSTASTDALVGARIGPGGHTRRPL